MNIVEAGLYSALSNDSDITDAVGGEHIFNSVAPQGQARPYIIYVFTGGGHENINPSELINMSYMVKAVADDGTEAGDIDALIQAALHKQTLTVTGYTNFYTHREEEMQLVETAGDGTLIHHHGAQYRIRIDD